MLALLILIPLYLLALMAIIDALKANRKPATYSTEALQSKITESQRLIPTSKPASVKAFSFKALPAPKPILLLSCPPFIFKAEFIECEVEVKDNNDYFPDGSKIQIGVQYA